MSESGFGPTLSIVGGGPVGMTLALAASRRGLRVLLLDARAAGAWDQDPRALALSEGSRQLLDRLGAWPAGAATAIDEVHVSQRGGFGRTLLRAGENDVPALGYVVAYSDLCRALDAAVNAAGIALRYGCAVSATRADALGVTLSTPAGELTSEIVVHAEGAGSEGSEVFDYGQDALLCEAEPLHPHHGRAWERFTADGPLALLPRGQRYAVVFVARRQAADELHDLNDAAFLDRLHERMNGRLRFVAVTPRSRVPLALRVRKHMAKGRELWIGNAAQSLHPVSGQGLNLGLRDAWELADALAHAGDASDPAGVLAEFARRRRVDRFGGIGFTDGIVRIFSNDLTPLRFARGLGLGALDLVPPARHLFAARMIFGTRS